MIHFLFSGHLTRDCCMPKHIAILQILRLSKGFFSILYFHFVSSTLRLILVSRLCIIWPLFWWFIIVGLLTLLSDLSLNMVSLMVRYKSQHESLNSISYAALLISNIWLQICMIANICPETVEEAFAIVPSLKVWLVWDCGFLGRFVNYFIVHCTWLLS